MQSASGRGEDQDGMDPEGRRPRRHVGTIDTTDYAHRHFVNLVSAALLLLIGISIVWTVKAIEAHEKLERCLSSGKRDCIDLNIPPRHGVRLIGR